jgi:hypothetical protein
MTLQLFENFVFSVVSVSSVAKKEYMYLCGERFNSVNLCESVSKKIEFSVLSVLSVA